MVLGRPHRHRRHEPGLADSSQKLADSSPDLPEQVYVACRNRSMRAAARYSVGVMPKRCRKARLNGPIEP